MSDTVTLTREDGIAVVTIDDGKANALSFDVLDAINAALDASADAGAIIVRGRPGMLTGGFDLAVMRGADVGLIGSLVTTGGDLMARLYDSPIPVVCECTGHAVAAGALMLLASHFRVGADGAFRIGLIETAIGMVLPDWGILLAQERLTPRHLQQAAVEARVYAPGEAVDAGFLDLVAAAEDVHEVALREATRLAGLPRAAYAGSATKIRGAGVGKLRAALAADRAQIAALGG